MTSNLTLASDFDFEKIAKHTPGYVGADLLSLIREAAMAAVNRVFNTIKEQRKIDEALAVQRAGEVKAAKLKAAEELKEAEKSAVNSISLKEDEIVVDDEVPKAEEKSAGDSVVVLDDTDDQNKEDKLLADDVVEESKENVEVAALASVEVEPDIIVEEESQSPLDEMPVDEPKPLSTLEELQSWLHDSAPINDQQLQDLSITMDDFAQVIYYQPN